MHGPSHCIRTSSQLQYVPSQVHWKSHSPQRVVVVVVVVEVVVVVVVEVVVPVVVFSQITDAVSPSYRPS